MDADALQFNLDMMARYFAQRPCKLRPHFKSHKCVTLAHRQLQAGGAVGITAAKLSEAEALVAGGIADVLIANQVVGPGKCRRLAELNRRAVVRVAVDSPQNVRELDAAAREAGVTLGVLVEVDIGMNRCGVQPGEPTFALARQVRESPGLRFDGLQGYEGHLVLLPDAGERARRATECIGRLVALRSELEKRGLPCAIISGGGTGTYDVTGNIEGMNEVQAGSYALMDKHYKTRRPEFRNAMFVLATVISVAAGPRDLRRRPQRDRLRFRPSRRHGKPGSGGPQAFRRAHVGEERGRRNRRPPAAHPVARLHHQQPPSPDDRGARRRDRGRVAHRRQRLPGVGHST